MGASSSPSAVASRRRHRKPVPPDAPRRLHARALTAHAVSLVWSPAPARAAQHHHEAYELLRDGKAIARLRGLSFTDTTVAPGQVYRYRVRIMRPHHRRGPLSASLVVRVPRLAPRAPAPPAHLSGATTGGQPAVTPPPAPTPPAVLSAAMVDRMFWRAGFGPSDADRTRWTGQKVSDLIAWLVGTPNSYAATSTPPLTYDGYPIDPLASDYELVLEWLDRMQRATNPLVERLTFFWHRHWAVSRADGIPGQFMLAYRNRLQRYADLGANPGATFHQLALEMTTQDAAMSVYLNGDENVAAAPNENYGREFMELFCLGVVNDSGQPNYTQSDVHNLARAFTGWDTDEDPSSPTYGQITFDPDNFDSDQKTIFGNTGYYGAADGVSFVLGHSAHPAHIVRKLWGEFIATPIPADALASLTSTYVSSGLQIAPLVTGILSHPLIFESIDEPNLVKPPIVHCVGLLRALGVPLAGTDIPDVLDDMQQEPYEPPNVAGWEGGLAWLNSNTVQARFDVVVRAQNLKYGNYPGTQALVDVPGETAQAAFDRAYGAVGSPWLSDGARAALLAYAQGAPTDAPEDRIQRVYALQAFMVGGPDGQVM